jgi:hypothetical protein
MTLAFAETLTTRLRPTKAAVQFGMVTFVSRVTESCGTGTQREPLNSLPSTAHEVPATSWLRSEDISRPWPAEVLVSWSVKPSPRLSMRRTSDWLSKVRCAVIVDSESSIAVEIDREIDCDIDRESVFAAVEIEAESSAVCLKVAISSEVAEPVSEISDK